MTVISVEHLSKSYRLGMIGGGTLREDVSRWWARMRRKPDPNLKIGEEHHARHIGEEFWALRDVSFEVKEGEILGIIGRNGAGKSTLLKILSRVTGPTSGCVKIKGRIASLLEVGTGFHPELTGRENVFLNGTILGMTKAEIRRKFDEIVAFSEIEEFIDTPVKRYSSGMYVRLAFAVAAHLEPEILIVDEVLAVGDAQFQKKCLGKMQDVAKGGRTVLFVSHNAEAIHRLTSLCLLLVAGRAGDFGPTSQVLKEYQNKLQTGNASDINSFRTVANPSKVGIVDIWFSDCSGTRKKSFLPRENIYLHITVRSKSGESLPCEMAFALETDSYIPIMASHYSDRKDPIKINQNCQFKVEIRPNILRHGRYYISTGVYSMDFRIKHDELLHMPAFEIEGFDPEMPKDQRWGSIYLPFNWDLQIENK